MPNVVVGYIIFVKLYDGDVSRVLPNCATKSTDGLDVTKQNATREFHTNFIAKYKVSCCWKISLSSHKRVIKLNKLRDIKSKRQLSGTSTLEVYERMKFVPNFNSWASFDPTLNTTFTVSAV